MSRSLKEQYLFLKLRTTHDPEVFGKLYDLYVDQIYRFIYFKVSSKEEAEDLTGEVFLKTWQYINDIGAEAIDNLRAFLYQTARNTVIDFYRTRGQEEPLLGDETQDVQLKIDLEDPRQDILEDIKNKSDMEEVRQALQKMREEYREVIVLRFIEEMNVKETAEVLGKTEGAVRVLLHRALEVLRGVMSEKNLGSKR